MLVAEPSNAALIAIRIAAREATKRRSRELPAGKSVILPQNHTFQTLPHSPTNHPEITRITRKPSVSSDLGDFDFFVCGKQHAIGVIFY